MGFMGEHSTALALVFVTIVIVTCLIVSFITPTVQCLKAWIFKDNGTKPDTGRIKELLKRASQLGLEASEQGGSSIYALRQAIDARSTTDALSMLFDDSYLSDLGNINFPEVAKSLKMKEEGIYAYAYACDVRKSSHVEFYDEDDRPPLPISHNWVDLDTQ
jgi:hypothetical protein